MKLDSEGRQLSCSWSVPSRREDGTWSRGTRTARPMYDKSMNEVSITGRLHVTLIVMMTMPSLLHESLVVYNMKRWKAWMFGLDIINRINSIRPCFLSIVQKTRFLYWDVKDVKTVRKFCSTIYWNHPFSWLLGMAMHYLNRFKSSK